MSNQNNQILDKVGKPLPTNKFRRIEKLNYQLSSQMPQKFRTNKNIFQKILNKIIYKLKKHISLNTITYKIIYKIK